MTEVVGILNITPDSFSGGGSIDPQAILAKAQALIAQGADVLDVGAESTRPDATPLNAQEEWARLAPIWPQLAALCREHYLPLSLDTRHAQTASKALAIGCDWVNDVSGFNDPTMLDAVRGAGCRLVVMHSLSVPAVRGEALPPETDICAFMQSWIAQTQARLEQEGVDADRLIFDAGIGFGKSPRQSFALLANLAQWRGEATLLMGHSRKSFLSAITDAPAEQRDAVTRAISAMLAAQKVEYLRLHDVSGHRKMLDALS